MEGEHVVSGSGRGPAMKAASFLSARACMLGMGAACLLWAQAAGAGEVVELTVEHEKGVYRVYADVVLYAPVDAVRAVLTDYEELERLSPSILKAETLESPEAGVVRVRTVAEACALGFCRKLTRVEDVHNQTPADLQADIVPGLSDFDSGSTHWRFLALGTQTRLIYEGSLEPGFWVPPLIGPGVVKRGLRREFDATFTNLEALAQAWSSEHAGQSQPQASEHPENRETEKH